MVFDVKRYVVTVIDNSRCGMNDKKQVLEMAKLLCTVMEGDCDACIFGKKRDCPPIREAERLYKAGYRKQIENAVEVVRCEDCVYRLKDDVGRGFCELGDFYVGETDYCSRGESSKHEQAD